MAFSTSTSDGVTAEMNVLPLIDILLVLVIVFFVLNLGFQFIPAQIPPRQASAVPVPPVQLVLELRENGGYALNGQSVPDDQVLTHLTMAFEGRPAKILFLKAHPSRSYGEMVAAMDVGREAGAAVLAWMPDGPNPIGLAPQRQ